MRLPELSLLLFPDCVNQFTTGTDSFVVCKMLPIKQALSPRPASLALCRACVARTPRRESVKAWA